MTFDRPGEHALAAGALPAESRVPDRRGFGRSLVPLLLLLGVVQFSVAGLIGWTIFAERSARESSRRETDTMLLVNGLVQAAVDAETGQRGYLLTGRELYLEPYDAAKARIAQLIGRLGAMFPDERSHEGSPALAALARSLTAKFAELDSTIALARAGQRTKALALVNTDAGRREMDAIRTNAKQLAEQVAVRRSAAFARASRIETASLGLVLVLGLGTFALVTIGLSSERIRAHSAAEAAQAAALRQANERAQLLARELNHRVKNFFSIVMAIVSLSGRKRPSAAPVVDDIRSRIHALAVAHEVSQGELGGEGVTVGGLIRRIATPYLGAEDERVFLSGPEIPLTPYMVTPLGLIIHELATNAVKYGALSTDHGRIEIDWKVLPDGHSDGELRIEWIELGSPAFGRIPEVGGAPGFGSRMIELAVRQIGGRIEREWPKTGAVVRLACPLSLVP